MLPTLLGFGYGASLRIFANKLAKNRPLASKLCA